MVLTPSTMVELNTPAPDFNLTDAITEQRVSLDTFASAPALLVVFMCNHCPYVRHILPRLVTFARDNQQRGLAVVGINANDAISFPDDSPPRMAQEGQRNGMTFPYLYDETQQVAKAFHAACTPDFFLYDANRRLVYRGRFDDSRPDNDVPVTGSLLQAAVDAVLAGEPVRVRQKPSIGCNIKWKPGNEPNYV